MEFGRIGIWGNTAKPSVKPRALELISWLESRGRQAVVAEPLATAIGRSADGVAEERLGESIDLLVSLGGDGSLLHSVRLVGGAGVPVLGVNLGRLGFLAEVPTENMLEAMAQVLEGNYKLEARMNLEATLRRDGEDAGRFLALNDVVVDRGASPRLLELEIRIEGVWVTTYAGDGLIVATPTGSTGHSLSASGPVVNPSTRVLIITPICAHSLAARTIIVSDEERVEVAVSCPGHEARVSVDGQVGIAAQSGDLLDVRAAAQVTHLVKLNDTSFYEILRTKFRWGNPRPNGNP